MPAEPPLAAVQRWVQAFIVSPGTAEEALGRASDAGGLAASATELIRPSPRLTAQERLEIYREMYPLRMVEAMESDYPAVSHFLGQERFRSLVMDYVQVHPSRSYTLNRLGDHLPEFLLATGLHRRRFLHDLARLERGVCQVFDAPPTAVLTAEDLLEVPADAWGRAILVPISALRIMAFDYPVNAYLQAMRSGSPTPSTRRSASRVAVYRPAYSMRRLELSGAGHDLLRRLVEGVPLGPALLETSRRHRGLGEEEVFAWLRAWVGEGMLRSLELASS